MKKHKKLIIFFSVLLALGLCVALIMVPHKYIPTISDSLSISSHTDSQPDMIAHRGLSSLAPQNSLPAAELAVKYGYDGCEFDLHTTKDGKWVVIHDDTVDDMTDGEGRVEDFTLEEIRGLTIDNGNEVDSYGELRVPTLEEYLEVLKDSETKPVIEIKNCDVKYLPLLKETVEEYDLEDEAIFISFNREYLEKYKQLSPEAEMMLLVSVISEDDVKWCVEKGVEAISFHYFDFYKSIKGWKAAKEADLELAAWTVDNTVYKDVMVLLGAESITTNKLIIKK